MFRVTWRNLLAHKSRLLMSTLAIVLGVGFLTGVLTMSGGLSRTYDAINTGSTPDALARPDDSRSSDERGGLSRVFTREEVSRLAALPEVARADGSVEGGSLTILGKDGRMVGLTQTPTLAFNRTQAPNLLGHQPMQLAAGRWPRGGPAGDNEIVLDVASAERAGYEVGDVVKAVLPVTGPDGSDTGSHKRLRLVGTMHFAGGGIAGTTMVVFSTRGAQRLFVAGGDYFTSVKLTAAPGVSQIRLALAAGRAVPDGFEAVPGDQVVDELNSAVGRLLGVVTVFLGVFAVIAVLVGGFIIANTFAMLIAHRLRELALLRALGASQKQVRRSVLAEAFVMALLGSSLGMAVGVALSRGLARLFERFDLPIDSSVLVLSPVTVVAAYTIGVAVTLVAAARPARRAAEVSPVAAMREDPEVLDGGGWRRTTIGAGWLLVGVALAAIGLAGAPGAVVWVGAAAVIWVLTVAGLSAVIGRPLLVLSRTVLGVVFGAAGRLAGDNALRNPRRTGATASALMIGLALVSCVGVLATSMSATVDDLVDEQFAADFVVETVSHQSMPVTMGGWMAEVKGVAVVSRRQVAQVRLGESETPTLLDAVDQHYATVHRSPMVEGTQKVRGNQAFVAQSVAEQLGLRVGDRLVVHFPGRASVRVRIVGIAEDGRGVADITAGLSIIEQAGLGRADRSLNILLGPRADKEAVKERLVALAAEMPIVTVQDKRDYARELKTQVNQLLYIVYGLVALSIVIAVIGIVNTLSLSVVERTREIGLLRAVGLSRRKLRRMVRLESVMISLLGAVLGLGLGVLIGVALQRAMTADLTRLALPWGSLVAFLVIAVAFGVVAAIAPAVRASRMKVLDAISRL